VARPHPRRPTSAARPRRFPNPFPGALRRRHRARCWRQGRRGDPAAAFATRPTNARTADQLRFGSTAVAEAQTSIRGGTRPSAVRPDGGLCAAENTPILESRTDAHFDVAHWGDSDVSARRLRQRGVHVGKSSRARREDRFRTGSRVAAMRRAWRTAQDTSICATNG
jgi:hypothetical protein